MKLVKIVASLLAAGFSAGAYAGSPPLFSEGFDDVPALAAAGWVFTNDSTFTNASTSAKEPWFQGNEGIFAAQAGAASSYAGANFNSTNATDGVIDNWLISPELSVGAGSSLSFYTRASDVGFLDLLEVRFSSGADTAVSGFTTLLGTVGSTSVASYPVGDWIAVTLTLPTAVSGRFAFHYSVPNALDASYIGIDSVTVSAVPEPTSALLLGLGLVAVAATERRTRAGRAAKPSSI